MLGRGNPPPETRIGVAFCIALGLHVAIFAEWRVFSQTMRSVEPTPATLRVTLERASPRPTTQAEPVPSMVLPMVLPQADTPPVVPIPQPIYQPILHPVRHLAAKPPIAKPLVKPLMAQPKHREQSVSTPLVAPPVVSMVAPDPKTAVPSVDSSPVSIEPTHSETFSAPIEEIHHPVAYRNNPSPVYPLFARRQGFVGTVRLAVVVDVSGFPIQVGIKDSSGYSVLDEAAREAVQHWRFEPAQQAGQAMIATVEVPIRFQLTESH